MTAQRDFRKRIAEGVLVVDGAMGTQVAELGLPSGTPPETLNLTQPDAVEAIHRGYAEAGAEAVLTNTFGGNLVRLTEFGLADRLREINTSAAKIARAAVGEDRYVLGDVGPTGHDYRLPPYGEDDPQVLLDGFRQQAQALAEAGVDAILVETMMSLQEACLAVRGVREACDLPVLCSMSFKKPPEQDPDDLRTFWGDDVRAVVAQLTAAGAEALGSNCGELVEEMPRLAARLRAETDLPLIFEVNAGRPALNNEYSTVYELEPEIFADIGRELVAAGAGIVGGCCGTTPAHIRALNEAVSSRG